MASVSVLAAHVSVLVSEVPASTTTQGHSKSYVHFCTLMSVTKSRVGNDRTVPIEKRRYRGSLRLSAQPPPLHQHALENSTWGVSNDLVIAAETLDRLG